jgi:serine O-acetyltransferase
LRDGAFKDGKRLPSRRAVISIICDLQGIMFPTYFGNESLGLSIETMVSLRSRIGEQIAIAIGEDRGSDEALCLADRIIEALPQVQSALMKDVDALYEGDPAARSPEEIILSYPGFYAISIYRIAHEFYIRKIPYIARLMTEFAHEKTGIDIHAGATIGEYFFIDHGTGIVIGETTTIGDHVRIYQGVTLGAKSFELDEDGNPVKGVKRHPDIGNNCIIYANATILGGNTKIGDGCVIGGNVWLTHSVPAGKVVYYNENK